MVVESTNKPTSSRPVSEEQLALRLKGGRDPKKIKFHPADSVDEGADDLARELKERQERLEDLLAMTEEELDEREH